MSADHDMRAVMATLPVPDLDGSPFAPAPALGEASVAIVTTAGLHTADDESFGLLDPAFRVILRVVAAGVGVRAVGPPVAGVPTQHPIVRMGLSPLAQ